jgi:hypothetical protein
LDAFLRERQAEAAKLDAAIAAKIMPRRKRPARPLVCHARPTGLDAALGAMRLVVLLRRLGDGCVSRQ